MMRKLAHRNVVCVDATHGRNGYDFQLITIMVIDELGEGFPAAWCLSNREDKIALTNLFAAVKQNTGDIESHWFMSDDADQYYSSWIHIFSNNACNKLLCTWHVDRSWRKGGLTKIKNKESQVHVYHTLRILLDETEQKTFEVLLQNALFQWKNDEQLKEFHTYFISNYELRKREWASCYRKNAMVNTNMYVEAFHRVLKHVYMKGTVNKRVDTCITTLLRFA